jgi:hypothetical protein
MLSSLGLDPAHAGLRLRQPTRRFAERWLARQAPTLVHVAGVDSHQAIALLDLDVQHAQRHQRDGIALKDAADTSGVDLVSYLDFAALVCGGKQAPDLVVCNVYNSASRTASACIMRGAKYAIGFHDVIEDGLAALFCSALYRELAASRGDMLAAFQAAMGSLRRPPAQLRGACIVLWTRDSLVQAPQRRAGAAPREALARVEDTPPWARIRVERQPKSQFNYSLLHNQQSLFRSLQVFRNPVQGPIRDIRVLVDLNAGDGSLPFATTFELADGENGRDLTNEVVLPLTSSLIRTQSERIQSSLRLLVTCEGQTVKEETFRVGLSPVDEWQDGDQDQWRWLPSFVLPRDPAVARIIDSAQGILCALADDPNAGFDGYQSVDPNGATEADRYASVDKQVQAIWYAVLNMHGLSYINPPPSYGKRHAAAAHAEPAAGRAARHLHRPRTAAVRLPRVHRHLPGAVPAQRPCVRRLLAQRRPAPAIPADAGDRVHARRRSRCRRRTAAAGATTATNNPGYVLGQSQHPEVQQRVQQRQLIPLEATWLTSRGGFESAATEGQNNLRRPAEFQAMIDIRLARDRG